MSNLYKDIEKTISWLTVALMMIFAFISCSPPETKPVKALTFQQKIEKINSIKDVTDRRLDEYKQINLADGSDEEARWKTDAFKHGNELRLVKEVFAVDGKVYDNLYYFDTGYLHYVRFIMIENGEEDTLTYYFWVQELLKSEKNGNKVEILGEKKDELITKFLDKEKSFLQMVKTQEVLPNLKFRPQDFLYD